MELNLTENETNDYNHEKKTSWKHINFMRNTWKNMDQAKKKKFKRIAHQKLKIDQEIKDFDNFIENIMKNFNFIVIYFYRLFQIYLSSFLHKICLCNYILFQLDCLI